MDEKTVNEALAKMDGLATLNGIRMLTTTDWQIIRARLVELEAENERLQTEVDRRFGIGAEMIAARRERDNLQSRLAAADALLRDIVSYPWFVSRAPLTTAEITAHLSENGNG